MGALDMTIAALVLGGAGWLLYRSLARGPGRCHGCGGGRCGAGERAPPEGLVSLGRARRR